MTHTLHASCNGEMTDDEFRARADAILAEEAGRPLSWWWLSFVSRAPDVTDRFLGACLVEAHGFLGATFVALARECNPGGEVAGIGPMPLDMPIPEGWTYRLLTREECATLERLMTNPPKDPTP
jgi:hypothetical protein